MSTFYNPYNFLPVEPRTEGQRLFDLPREAMSELGRDKRKHVTHERYVPETYSGRIVARLTTVTPVAVGATQTRRSKDDYATVEPYLRDGKPAFPASSLKGMLGSLMEAASNGPLRVLENRAFSYRREMTESLSAIGLVVKDGEDWKLKPMCLPSLESKDGGRTFPVPKIWKDLFPAGPRFKVFFGDRKLITSADFKHRTAVDPVKQAVPWQVKQLGWAGGGVACDRALHLDESGRFALAQRADSRDPQMKGLARVLGCWGGRTKHIPPGKKHELWIPLPADNAPLLPISAEAIKRFEELADERTDADPELPYEPRDTPRNLDKAKHGSKLRLKPNDMVYFDISDDGSEVVEISYSAIWRSRVEDRESRAAFRAHDFFRKIDSELPPFQPDRTQVTLAEQMLGFVEEIERTTTNGEEAKKPGLQLAGRLRFADARPHPDAADLLEPSYVPLKILGSPKPPCPPMYFSPDCGPGFVEKREVSPEKYQPNGRKWYLHARSSDEEQSWRTGHPENDPKQKNRVKPIRRGKEFFFHIDFDNLDETELGLLLFALEPNAKFHHKLGMGKPLGLGSVKIEVLGMFRIVRERRYTPAGLGQPRYSAAEYTAAGRALRDNVKWPERYKSERECAPTEKPWLGEVRQKFDEAGIVSDRVRRALAIVGDYENAPPAAEVRYPTTTDQRDKELEHYKWFVFNTGQRYKGRGMSPSRQSLKPLGGEDKLPAMEELSWKR